MVRENGREGTPGSEGLVPTPYLVQLQHCDQNFPLQVRGRGGSSLQPKK